MITKKENYAGEIEYSKCSKCGLIANFDMSECPTCKEEEQEDN